jgi:hypothetical protein
MPLDEQNTARREWVLAGAPYYNGRYRRWGERSSQSQPLSVDDCAGPCVRRPGTTTDGHCIRFPRHVGGMWIDRSIALRGRETVPRLRSTLIETVFTPADERVISYLKAIYEDFNQMRVQICEDRCGLNPRLQTYDGRILIADSRWDE